MNAGLRARLARVGADYGMLGVLLALCGILSWLTLDRQYPSGPEGARRVLSVVSDHAPATVLIAVRDVAEERAFAEAVAQALAARQWRVAGTVAGQPSDARRKVEALARAGQHIDLVVCSHATAAWPLWQSLDELHDAEVVEPPSYRWPNFLKPENLLNIANQITVIAILAIGMTLVIITGGIDLSVGSLIALAAVVATWLIRQGGGEQATVVVMVLAALAGVAACGGVGLFSGVMVTRFGIPPFIVTLGMMLVASGLAYILAEGQSIYQVPQSFTWLGRGTTVGALPNAVVLMLLLYGLAHVLMTRTRLGREIYAVGGNREAARLSGVAVERVLRFVYAVCGALAGLGGVVTASQLKSGSPTYGLMYELYTIAAVVVGGTSLSGGVGRVLGTLIGACIIAVIQNGMNLTGVESYTQKVVLGLVILGAVLLDMVRKRGR